MQRPLAQDLITAYWSLVTGHWDPIETPLHIGIEARYLFAREKTGVENYTSQLVRHLGRIADLPPLTLYTDAPPVAVDEASAEILECPRLRVRVVPNRRFWLRLWVPLAARRDGVTVMHFPGSLVIGWQPFRAVVTIYDLTALRAPQLALEGDARLADTVVRRSVARSAHVVADSQTTARDVEELFRVPPERVTATPLAADERFRPVPGAAEQVAARFGLRQPYLLFVGTPLPRKNFRGVLEAFARLGPAGDGVTLAVASRKEWAVPGVRELAETLGIAERVRFLGDLPDEALPTLYSGARMLVHPAFFEGFGLTVVEAMACGTPVVTSNTSVLPEVAGDAALLVDPYHSSAIVDAIRRLLGDDRLHAEYARRGLERAAFFSWDRTAALTLEAYRKAAAAMPARIADVR